MWITLRLRSTDRNEARGNEVKTRRAGERPHPAAGSQDLRLLCRPVGNSGQGLAQASPVAVGAGETVVEVDPFGLDAELEQRLALGGEVLLVGGAAGVADPDRGHERQAYG
jgi:hypothetical protein